MHTVARLATKLGVDDCFTSVTSAAARKSMSAQVKNHCSKSEQFDDVTFL
jgi:hypothetical protein